MMNSLREALDINNAMVCQHMATGTLQPAATSSGDCTATNKKPDILAWHRAVMRVRSFHQHCIMTDTVDGTTSQRGQGNTKVSIYFHQEVSDVGALQCGGIFVYTRPLLLSPTLLEISKSTCHQAAVGLVASVTCLFNLALAWHGKSLVAGDANNSLERDVVPNVHAIARDKAQKLYQLILAMLDHPDCVHSNHRDETYTVLKCLVLNNSAHLLYAQGDHANCQGILNRQRMILASVDMEYIEAHIGATLLRELMLNALHMTSPHVALAA